MKSFKRLLLTLVSIYLLFWGGVSAYFSFAERHIHIFESSLSSMFDRPVKIGQLSTSWDGFTPQIQIENLVIEGDIPNQPAFSFSSLSAELKPLSLLGFWPKFEAFAVDSPQLEIVSLNDGSLQVAGLDMGNSGGASSDRLINWLLDQRNAVWHKGTLVWRREGKQAQRYENISFVYARAEQDRQFNAAIETAKGAIAIKAQTQGNLFSQTDWGANFEVLGSGGRRLLSADDLSAEVIDGEGELSLKAVNVERIQDFLHFAGLNPDRHWLLSADVEGRLHDLKFFFNGPLLKIDDWSLRGSASNIGFKSEGDAPSMNNLSGDVSLGSDGGSFRFATRDSELRWPAQFYHPFPLKHAEGELEWQRQSHGAWDVHLRNANFEDPAIKISNLNAHAQIINQSRRIENLGDLFKVNSVTDLDFDEGDLVLAPKAATPATLQASADFEVNDVTLMTHYLPKLKSLNLFRKWSASAFRSGTFKNGKLSYEGELSFAALEQGRANFLMSADFEDALVDYGPAQNWPAVTKASGKAKMENQRLSILPEKALMMGDALKDGEIVIERLFELDRTLKLKGKLTTSLVKGIDFLFKGPLIKPENQLETLPFQAHGGWVDMDVVVTMPLNNINSVQVQGSSVIRDGEGTLPSKMPLSDLAGKIFFTEKTITSDKLTASFIGGDVQAKLTTEQPAQPPVMRLSAQGRVNAQNLEPWIGEHLLTLMDGETDWQGSMLIDGNKLKISGSSDLKGLQVSAPEPIGKTAEQTAQFGLDLDIGVNKFDLDLSYRDLMRARFKAEPKPAIETQAQAASSIFDRCMISLRASSINRPNLPIVQEGVNFDLQYPGLDIDAWLSTIVDLASYVPRVPVGNTLFLDSMRSVKLQTANGKFLGRPFGEVSYNAISVDGKNWISKIGGSNIEGTGRFEPREGGGQYEINLSRLNIPHDKSEKQPAKAVDYDLLPSTYPAIALEIEQFAVNNKRFGQLSLKARPAEDSWKIDTFSLTNQGIVATAQGFWVNNAEQGSISNVEFDVRIDEADDTLEELAFDDILRKGKGSVTGILNWIGAPHEFDYSRLNGDFNAFVKDGELVQVEPGGGKILGLLNMNAILRRLVFDFSDVVATGLRFDRMRFKGVLADGEAVLQDAFILSPAVFVTMEGNLNLDNESIDMEVHVSPELGGNIALLSALANPAAGAVVFITQQLFKDDLRRNSFRSFRALGTWEEFEFEEISKKRSKKSQAQESEAVGDGQLSDAQAPESENKDVQIFEKELRDLQTQPNEILQ